MLRNKLEAFGSSNQHVRLMTSNELDKCLREALFVNNVGCSDTILFDISQATYHDAFFDRIMKAAWRCVSSRPGRVRRIQKGLNLLNYLAVNGSENCISEIQKHMDVLHAVTKLRFSQANRDLGQLVIDKANQLTALVMDSRTLQDKRRYAASIRDRFVSVGSTNGMVKTAVLHKPVFVLDKTKNNPPSQTNSFSGFGNSSQHPVQHVGPGRRFLSKLFRTNLKISNRPHNIGLYGNNLNNFNSNSNNPGFDTFDRGFGSYTDRPESNFEDNTFNAFPVLNNTNDNYYKHNFSRVESKNTNRSYAKKDSDSDHTFKYYSSSSDAESRYSDSASDSESDSTFSRKSSTSSSSDSSSVYTREHDYRRKYESDRRLPPKQLKAHRKYSSSSSSSSESTYRGRRRPSNYKKSGRNDYSSTYTSTTSSYASNNNHRQHEYGYNSHRPLPSPPQYNRPHYGYSARPTTYVSSGYSNRRSSNPFSTR